MNVKHGSIYEYMLRMIPKKTPENGDLLAVELRKVR